MKILKFIKSKKRYFAIGAVVIIGAIAVTATAKGIAKSNSKTDAQSQGLVTAKEVSLNSKIPGRIVKFYVSEGDAVKAGDILVEISSGELMAKKEQVLAQVEQAQAGVNASQAQVEQAQAGLNMAQAGYNAKLAQIKQAQAGYTASEKQRDAASATNDKANNGARKQEIAEAESAYNYVKTTYDKLKKLYEGGAISEQRLNEIETQMEVTKQKLDMAKEGARAEDKAAASAALGAYEAGVSSSSSVITQAQEAANAALAQVNLQQAMVLQAQSGLDASKGKFEQANAALSEVEVYLEDTLIKSPIDGTVTTLNSDEGELVSTGTSIGTVSNLDTCWVTVNLDEDKLSNVSEGQTVKVTLPTYKGKTFEGTVVTINKQPDFATKKATNENGNFDIVSYGVKVELQNKDQTLRPGMSAYVKFEG